jgi:Bacterial Ig domain
VPNDYTLLFKPTRALLIWAFIAAFWLAACDRRPEGGSTATDVSRSILPTGVVDSPLEGATLKGTSSISGWVICEDGIKAVRLYLDRRFIEDAKLGGSRPDVNKAFPGFPSGDTPGWSASIDASTIVAGSHQITVQAESNKGAVRELATRNVVIAH